VRIKAERRFVRLGRYLSSRLDFGVLQSILRFTAPKRQPLSF
jgi:hypothetical protein